MLRTGLAAALLILALVSFAQQRGLVHEDSPLQPRAFVALAIGNAKYSRSPLTNPVNDARDVAGVLKELGFAVELAVDVDYRKLGTSIDRFVTRLRRGDVAVFYYAGHGIQIEGENYLVPTDFEAQDEASAKYAAYPVDRLMEGMERSGAKLNIIILDACRNNPYRGSRALSGGLAPIGAGAGTFVALATSPGKTASDNSKGANGLFTSYLLESLKQPGLTLDEVFNRTREKVYSASKQAQTPWSQTNVIGKFYFRPAASTALEVVPPQPAESVGVSAPPREQASRAYRDGVQESRNGQPGTAVEAFTQAIRLNPDNLDAYYERAMTYAASGQFQRAIDDFSRVLRGNPNDVNALIGRGASYINISEHSRAVADLDRVIRQEPENEIAYFNRGLSNAGLEQNREAINDYSQVVARRPKWPSTWYNRGIVHAASGDFRAALADYTEAIRLRPDYASAYANRGAVNAELDRLPQALADFDEAIRFDPENAAMLNSRGVVWLEMKNPAKALNDFNEAIRLNSLLGQAYSNRAEARRMLGDSAGAEADLKRARGLGVR
ncbi:MAG TPA: tetratricopeptide repeat protein [Bryobacteraceae bacterium]|nr:tetratricopeptide repeat protein [Bryobacteraceae bacterium]